MKFLELQIKGFGKLHNRSLSFEDGINVIYGRNEAGKSTIHTFIRGMLFGIQPQRGRASRNDLYSRYEPWENSGTYEGALRLEHGGHVYRIERSFQKTRKELHVIDETLGRELEPDRALMDELLSGLTETAYVNTISIGQLKSATDSGMVSELKNYIANMNTTGNMALNITKATDYLKKQRKKLEAGVVPEAARSYTTLLSEIKALEKEIASPEYENQLSAYQRLRSEARSLTEQKQKEKEQLLQKAARGRQALSQGQFTDIHSIDEYQQQTSQVYQEYQTVKASCEKKIRRILPVFFLLLAAGCLAGAAWCRVSALTGAARSLPGLTPDGSALVLAAAAAVCGLVGMFAALGLRRKKKELSLSTQALQETFSRHLGDSSISQEAMDAFLARMNEFRRLCAAMDKSDAAILALSDEIASLQEKQNTCTEAIERQQKNQWELEKKLELLSNYKTQAEALRSTLAENSRLSQELSAIDLALETMTGLSTSIRDSFGLYLNKTASDMISGITGGIYTSMSIDENLNAYMNTPAKLVPLDQVSSGTMDQIYLALRLAAAKLLQEGKEEMPLIFDDSFVLYDDDRLKSVLKWLAASCKGQILIFTCHQREAQMLTANQIPYTCISI